MRAGPPPSARTPVVVWAMVSCTTCAEDDQRNFSKRMLAGAWARKGAPVRCKACVSRAEEAERAAASAKASAAAASAAAAATARERCSGCSKLLEAAAFSRSQLLQKGNAKRCRACVSAAGAGGGSSLLSEAAAGVPRGANLSALRALPEPQPVIELSRLKKLKRLRRALPRLCAAEAGASPPILAFDRWLARCRLSEPEGTGDPLLPSSGGAEPGLVRDLCRNGRMEADAARRVATRLAEEAAQAAAQLARTASKAGAGAAGAGAAGGGAAGGGAAGEGAAGAGGAAEVVVLERGGASLRLSVRGSPKPYVDVTRAHLAKLRSLHATATAGRAQAAEPEQQQQQQQQEEEEEEEQEQEQEQKEQEQEQEEQEVPVKVVPLKKQEQEVPVKKAPTKAAPR